MIDEYKNKIMDAKKALKKRIKFFEYCLKNLNSSDEELRVKALIATFCIHRYMNENFIKDIEELLEKSFFPNEEIK